MSDENPDRPTDGDQSPWSWVPPTTDTDETTVLDTALAEEAGSPPPAPAVPTVGRVVSAPAGLTPVEPAPVDLAAPASVVPEVFSTAVPAPAAVIPSFGGPTPVVSMFGEIPTDGRSVEPEPVVEAVEPVVFGSPSVEAVVEPVAVGDSVIAGLPVVEVPVVEVPSVEVPVVEVPSVHSPVVDVHSPAVELSDVPVDIFPTVDSPVADSQTVDSPAIAPPVLRPAFRKSDSDVPAPEAPALDVPAPEAPSVAPDETSILPGPSPEPIPVPAPVPPVFRGEANPAIHAVSDEERKLAAERAARREARIRALNTTPGSEPQAPAPAPVVVTKRTTDAVVASFGLLVLRVVLAGIFAVRGFELLANMPAAEQVLAGTVLPQPQIWVWVAGFGSMTVSLMLLVGLLTRVAGAGAMLISAGILAFVLWGPWSPFTAGATDFLAGHYAFLGELELLAAVVGFMFLCVGGGGWSLDRSFRAAKSRDRSEFDDE